MSTNETDQLSEGQIALRLGGGRTATPVRVLHINGDGTVTVVSLFSAPGRHPRPFLASTRALVPVSKETGEAMTLLADEVAGRTEERR